MLHTSNPRFQDVKVEYLQAQDQICTTYEESVFTS